MGCSVQQGVEKREGEELAPPDHSYGHLELIVFMGGKASMLGEHTHLGTSMEP